jgi:hypothetical protein
MSKYGLDKFYTKDDIVDWCLSFIDVTGYDLVVEPSVGNGAFFNKIKNKNKLGIDIAPEINGENIITSDFLKWELNTFPLPKKILFVGNPPFGRNGSLALKFIKKAITYNADIAFILPRGFKKVSIYDRIPLNYCKVFEKDLPHNAFTYEGEDYNVPCVFQIYRPSNVLRKKTKLEFPKYFSFVSKHDANLSIRRVGVNAGTVFGNVDVSESSHYFIKTKYRKIIMLNVDRELFTSNDTTGPRSISKNDLIYVLDNAIEKNLKK